MTEDPELRPEGTSAIAAYKSILQEVLERRPSGTRQRLAQSLEKARSFVTQITNPAYPVPIPALHLSTIFEICHFSPAERQSFLAAYGEAHPRRVVGVAAGPRLRTIHLTVPDLGDETRNHDFQQAIQDFATSLAKLVRGGPDGRSKEEKPS